VLSLAISNGEVILIIVFATIPIAAATFALGSGKAYRQIGKGQFSVEFDHDLPQKLADSDPQAASAIRDAELRQMLEAKAYRQRERGEEPLDVETEMAQIRAEEIAGAPPGEDPALVEEVRQLVLARNARRERRGEDPLDVEAEVARQLRELESLGQ